ncbi:MAG TPA: hypothetical protein VN153_12175, partial [Tahibacter sp.]|nr:hypothetical protein [Tahibacter sp.]
MRHHHRRKRLLRKSTEFGSARELAPAAPASSRLAGGPWLKSPRAKCGYRVQPKNTCRKIFACRIISGKEEWAMTAIPGAAMDLPLRRTLHQLRNTRDLRAEILSLAASLLVTRAGGELIVTNPVISPATVRREWQQLLPALAADLRGRMTLVIEPPAARIGEKRSDYDIGGILQQLQKPNYRFEILRQLLRADLDGAGPQSVKTLLDAIGASQTPIRAALAELIEAGIVRRRGRYVGVRAEEISAELLAKLRAAPQILRYRFERGAQIKPP